MMMESLLVFIDAAAKVERLLYSIFKGLLSDDLWKRKHEV